MREELTMGELQDAMESGELTSVGICRRYLDRIEKLDRTGPRLGSVIEVNPDALAIARALDRERREGKTRGPLHGIPVLLKDNIDTHDRMRTTAGSIALEDTIAPRDAFVAKRLRSAGAVILGKTNLSEWANFRGKRSVSGWSSRGGLTRNPYALDRSACGSSSGSGAAVAADFAAAGVGTETDGSIICPAQTNGIVGIKPTVGLVSRSGIIPIAHSQDTAGPMARCVADAAILLGAIAGADRRIGDYRSCLVEHGLEGARIGVARELAGTDPKVLAVFESCLLALRDAGAQLVDPVDLRVPRELGMAELQVLSFELKADLNAYLAGRGRSSRVRCLEDLIRFNEDNRDRVMPYFGQEHMVQAQSRGSLSSRAYREALKKSRRIAQAEGIDRVVLAHRLDAVVTPSGGPAWLVDLVSGDPHSTDIASTSLAAVAGYPHVTVPAGYIHGLPVGISLFARAWEEATLIRLAFAFEQATRARRPPAFAAHADLGRCRPD